MNVVIGIALVLVAVAALLCLARVIRPGSVTERVVGLDTLLVVTVGGIAVGAAGLQRGTFLDALLVTSLLGFVATTLIARFIERRGA